MIRVGAVDYSSILIRLRPRCVDFHRSFVGDRSSLDSASFRIDFSRVSSSHSTSPRPAPFRCGSLAPLRSSLVLGSSPDLKQKSISHLRPKIESSRVSFENLFSSKRYSKRCRGYFSIKIKIARTFRFRSKIILIFKDNFEKIYVRMCGVTARPFVAQSLESSCPQSTRKLHDGCAVLSER